jgi:hypothetical protein
LGSRAARGEILAGRRRATREVVAVIAVARAVVVTSGPVAVVVSVALAMMERTVDQAVSEGGQGEK